MNFRASDSPNPGPTPAITAVRAMYLSVRAASIILGAGCPIQIPTVGFAPINRHDNLVAPFLVNHAHARYRVDHTLAYGVKMEIFL